MKDKKTNKPQPQPDPANLDQSELVSNQETTALPWFWGTRKVAVTWISPVYQMFTKAADSVPSKK